MVGLKFGYDLVTIPQWFLDEADPDKGKVYSFSINWQFFGLPFAPTPIGSFTVEWGWQVWDQRFGIIDPTQSSKCRRKGPEI
jgi:hypothetical protein